MMFGALAAVGVGTQLWGAYQNYQAAEEEKKRRAKVQAQIDALQANPSSIENLPQYQAGMQAAMRSGAAAGMLGGGGMTASLAQVGSNVYNQQMQSLLGQMYMGGQDPNQLMQQAIGGVGGAAGSAAAIPMQQQMYDLMQKRMEAQGNQPYSPYDIPFQAQSPIGYSYNYMNPNTYGYQNPTNPGYDNPYG